jgi:hexosaminidase
MKRIFVPLIVILCTGLLAAAEPPPPAIIPRPHKIEALPGVFELRSDTRIAFSEGVKAEGEGLLATLNQATGFKLVRGPLVVSGLLNSTEAQRDRDRPAIELLLSTNESLLNPEGYVIGMKTNRVQIFAANPAGMFYGVQTLLQLLPPQVFASNVVKGVVWTIPCVRIEDQPRFAWRGMMLDVGRHYFPVADIKRMLDAMALHKLNTFHWHLTEDQGWRIEIKKYPKLAEVGAWRASSPPYGHRNSDDGQRYGGFYTQAEVKEIVAYAAARHITVIPEIEMPGHAAAAIASYPELGNSDIPGYAPRVMTRWGVHPYIFAPKEETFRFLEDVLTEVCDLFPSKFIHIGGDEAPKDQWKKSPFAQEVMKREGLKDEHELQSWFIRRMEKFLASKGRRLVGWDEIQEGGLPKTATMMVWRDAKWAKHALVQGNDVVMATTSHTYLDYYQAPAALELAKGKEYEAIGGHLPLQKVYSYEPTFVAETPAQEKRILGTQGQLWAEYLKDMRKVEYMAFPRLSALAEVAWSPKTARDFDDFQQRLESQYQRFDALGLKYRRETSVKIGEWTPKQITTNGVTLEWDFTARLKTPGNQVVGLNYTKGLHGIRLDWVALLEDGREVGRDAHPGFAGANPKQTAYVVPLPTFKPGARYTIRAHVAGDGGADSYGTVHLELTPLK